VNIFFIQINSSRVLTRQNISQENLLPPFGFLARVGLLQNISNSKLRLHYLLWSCRPVSNAPINSHMHAHLHNLHACTYPASKVMLYALPYNASFIIQNKLTISLFEKVYIRKYQHLMKDLMIPILYSRCLYIFEFMHRKVQFLCKRIHLSRMLIN
jgi:hypothetical protein